MITNILEANPSLINNLKKSDIQAYNFLHTYTKNWLHGKVGDILLWADLEFLVGREKVNVLSKKTFR